MAVPTFTVECLRNDIIARDVYEFTFKKPDGFTFKAGQFVLFDVPLVENPTDFQPRAYSIASAPHEDELLFVLKLVPGGRTSRWVSEVLKPGMTIVMKGPFGNFVVHPSERPLLFVATGTGIAPFRSQLLHLTREKYAQTMDVIFGVRMEEDLFWLQEMQLLADAYPEISLHTTLTEGSPAWTGYRGRVQTIIPQIAPDLSQHKIYICGSPPMTKEVKTLAIEQWGMTKENVHAEAYI